MNGPPESPILAWVRRTQAIRRYIMDRGKLPHVNSYPDRICSYLAAPLICAPCLLVSGLGRLARALWPCKREYAPDERPCTAPCDNCVIKYLENVAQSVRIPPLPTLESIQDASDAHALLTELQIFEALFAVMIFEPRHYVFTEAFADCFPGTAPAKPLDLYARLRSVCSVLQMHLCQLQGQAGQSDGALNL